MKKIIESDIVKLCIAALLLCTCKFIESKTYYGIEALMLTAFVPLILLVISVVLLFIMKKDRKPIWSICIVFSLLLSLVIVSSKDLVLDLKQGPSSFELYECRLNMHDAAMYWGAKGSNKYKLIGFDESKKDYTFKLDYESYEKLLKEADGSLYEHKKSGEDYKLPNMMVECYKNSEILISYK